MLPRENVALQKTGESFRFGAKNYLEALRDNNDGMAATTCFAGGRVRSPPGGPFGPGPVLPMGL